MTVYTERGAIEPLLEGKTIKVKGVGNSMVPILMSGDVVIVAPATSYEVKKGDIVLAKVHGNVYLHKVTGIRKNGQVQISNNHGRVNGWTTLVYGKVIGRA